MIYILAGAFLTLELPEKYISATAILIIERESQRESSEFIMHVDYV
jgi:hypothetical protein